MTQIYDIIIAGAGLAGASAALYLSRSHDVLLLEADHPAAGASGAAAGLVNPLMGRKANLVWRMDEALGAVRQTVALARASNTYDTSGLFRPARDEEQAGTFRTAAADHPQHAAWVDAAAMAGRYPGVAAPHGALHIRSGGAVDVPRFVEAMLNTAVANGATVRTGVRVAAWGDAADAAFVATTEGERLRARYVVLALGNGCLTHPDLAGLGLHGIKGQTVRVRRPAGLGALPNLSGSGYIVPDGEALVIGSSYEHTYTDLQPSRAATRQILQKAARMVPILAESEVVAATAGVRVTVPRVRLPMLGPLPGHARCWVFTGLSSKGLLMAPLLARNLPTWLHAPDRIWPEIRVSG